MKLVNLTCPNCSGNLEKVGDKLYCNSCGGAFAIDYDDSDVEYEKLQTEDERARREFEHEKELLELKHQQEEQSRIAAEKREQKRETKKRISRAISSRITCLVVLLIFAGMTYGSYRLCVHFGVIPSFTQIIESAKAKAGSYDVKPEHITKDILDNMISAGESRMKSAHKNKLKEYVNNKWIEYKLDKVEYDSSYLITNAAEKKNRVVVIYKLTYKASKTTKTTYDACYFDGLKITGEGKFYSDYKPDTISKSKVAWKNDSFEEKEQCYRESVLAIEGTATELKR